MAAACVVGLTTAVRADIITEDVVYEIAGQPYEGYFALNEGFGDSQPLVIVIHDWDGIDDYEKRRTQMLAEQGYAAFAVDLYGQGVRPETTEESREQSGMLYADRQAMRDRFFAGLEQAEMMASVDPERVAVIGYCFGGSAVLEMARAGAPLDGFVTFHGGLDTPEGQDYSAVAGPLLILHGTDDPVAPMAQVAQLATDLNAADVDYSMELYGGVDHAFTVWGAGDRYDPEADLMSWDAMLTFLDDQLR
ncbi:dienelactone hydrolase [filamentous cyanobacterium CCP5]|nr:dienelactone hydrolase [filamentous cyanobacterium CCP5]